jgi:putative oxidoreductase
VNPAFLAKERFDRPLALKAGNPSCQHVLLYSSTPENMIRNSEKLRDVGLLVLRLGFGLGFALFHGLPKLQGGREGWAMIGQAMSNAGITFGYEWWGAAAMAAEFFGGLCFALGLFFRPACLALFSTMAIASLNHIITGQGSPSHAVKNSFVFAGMFFVGPGRYSLDHMIAARRTARRV